MVRFLAKVISLPGNALSALVSGFSVYLSGTNSRRELRRRSDLWLVLLASEPGLHLVPITGRRQEGRTLTKLHSVDSATRPSRQDVQQQVEDLFRLDDEGAGELLLVRHAEPAGSLDGDPPTDPMLSCGGLEQAERLAERLGDLWVEAIYTAPERRAFQTARIVADLTQRPVEALLDDLR